MLADQLVPKGQRCRPISDVTKASFPKNEPALENVLASTLKYAGPALQIAISAESGAAAGSQAGKIIADAQAGLTAASGLVYDFGAHPTVGGVIGSVANNLGSLLSAGHITNPSSVATVTSIVTQLNGLVQAINTTPPASASGGASAGKFASGTTGTCTVTITPGITATNGFTCDAHDLTTPADVINQTATSTTTATISGTTASGDVVTWKCAAF